MSTEQRDPHRLAALAALVSAAVLAILSIDIVISQFPRGLIVLVVVLIADGDHLVQALVIVAGLGLMLLATRSAFKIHVPLHPAPDPRHPVLFYNPKSGGVKAEKFHLAEKALPRGVQPIELTLGTDLEQLVRSAVADGADALAMAGGAASADCRRAPRSLPVRDDARGGRGDRLARTVAGGHRNAREHRSDE